MLTPTPQAVSPNPLVHAGLRPCRECDRFCMPSLSQTGDKSGSSTQLTELLQEL